MLASPPLRAVSVNREEVVMVEQGVDQVPSRPRPGIADGSWTIARGRGAGGGSEQGRLPREEVCCQRPLARGGGTRQHLLEGGREERLVASSPVHLGCPGLGP